MKAIVLFLCFAEWAPYTLALQAEMNQGDEKNRLTDVEASKFFEKLEFACENLKVDDASIQLKTVPSLLKSSSISPELRAAYVKEVLYVVLYSPIYMIERINKDCVHLGFETLALPGTLEKATPELFDVQLEIALQLLPRAGVAPERTANAALNTWGRLLSMKKSLADYSPENLKPLVTSDWSAGYSGPISSGMSPEGISDPIVRKRYEEHLKIVEKYLRNRQAYRGLIKVQSEYEPQLASVLKATYSGSPEKEAAGVAALEKHLDDSTDRQKLLEAIRGEIKSP